MKPKTYELEAARMDYEVAVMDIADQCTRLSLSLVRLLQHKPNAEMRGLMVQATELSSVITHTLLEQDNATKRGH